ncbi:MAG: FAD-dependent oxidoreductase [Methylobacteriaceae bacterium]|nr:FAD-dependent oxidoreductase [Methylobacteriaceae bacterium]
MPDGVVHVIGAGLAGLAAALSLTRRRRPVVVHEAAGQAGGRCRSYFDPALGAAIDNGNHLVLSGNHAALSFVEAVGARGKLVGPPHAEFDFADLATGKRWRISINDGRLPWWIFDAGRRVPGTKPADYAALLRLFFARPGARVGDLVRLEGPLYERFLQPFLVAALNTDPAAASAALARAVFRETVLKGGKACRPLVAANGLSSAFVDPCLETLAKLGATVRFGQRLRAVEANATRIARLDFGERAVTLGPSDAVVLAVPAPVATALVPGLTAPTAFRAIVNGHFAVAPPAGRPPVLGVIGGTIEWLFSFEGRLSTTTSNADRLCDMPREDLAAAIWQDVSRLTGLQGPMPAWQIVRERRATFAGLPEEDARRPQPQTQWDNLFLAGDWTATGLPATIEGAIRSGNRAAELVLHTHSRLPPAP